MSNQAQIEESFNIKDLVTNVKDHVRGEEVSDVKQKCLSLCQKYLAANWNTLTLDHIEVRRLTGGMGNKTYHCKIVDSHTKEGNGPQEVVFRFYGNKFDVTFNQNQDRFDDAIVGLLASEAGLGPQVLGIFKEGQIHKYYPHRHFNEEDFNDPKLVSQLASKVARFHALKAPVPTDYNYYKTLLKSSAQRLKESPEKWRKLFEKYDCKTLIENNMSSEVEWLLEAIPTFNSPVVFSHNDLRVGNIMVSEENEVVIGDLESFSYNERGLDFASLFFNIEPNSTGIKEFIKEYIREGEKIFGKSYSENAVNSVEHIMEELKNFSMVFQHLIMNILIHNDFWKFPFSEKTCMNICENSMQKYLADKKVINESKHV